MVPPPFTADCFIFKTTQEQYENTAIYESRKRGTIIFQKHLPRQGSAQNELVKQGF